LAAIQVRFGFMGHAVDVFVAGRRFYRGDVIVRNYVRNCHDRASVLLPL